MSNNEERMNKTKVEDALIQMITPKVKEIEEKFGRGEGLTQEDINTLLLKSQYNHINHLDEKLNDIANDNNALRAEVKADNARLKLEIEQRMGSLETKMEQRMGSFETRIEQRMGSLEVNFAKLETKMEQRMGSLETKFSDLKTDIQTSINSTMKWYIGGAGIVLVLLKALDLFMY